MMLYDWLKSFLSRAAGGVGVTSVLLRGSRVH